MNPEPLDFDFKNFFERFKEVYNTLKKDLGWEREFEEFIKDIKNLEEDINDCESSVLDYEYCVKLSMYYMYLKVKSACEFYLKYKNRAKKFITDFPEYAEDIVLIVDVYTDGKQMADYNDWLFKLAFKDVLGDEQ